MMMQGNWNPYILLIGIAPPHKVETKVIMRPRNSIPQCTLKKTGNKMAITNLVH
jgi:hypothetical protein